MWGVYSTLDWKFHDKDDAAQWLRENRRKTHLLTGIAGIIAVSEELDSPNEAS